MKRLWIGWRWIATGCAGLMMGGWLGTRSGPQELATVPPFRTISISREGHITSKSGKKDFASLVQRLQWTGGIPESGFASLGRASTTELQQLFCNLAERGAVREDSSTRTDKFKVMAAIAHELYLRHGEETLKWAESIESPVINGLLLAELAAQDPVRLKSRMDEFYQKFGMPGNFLVDAAYAGAALKGAEDLLAAESIFKHDGAHLRSFADGFDFKTYLSQTESVSGTSDGFRCWAVSDPDGAAKMLRGEGDRLLQFSPAVFGEAFEARRGVVEEREAAKWISGVIGSLQGNERKQALRELLPRNTFREDGTNLVPLIEELPEDEDRLVIASGYLSRGKLSLPVLIALKRDDLQTQVLAKWLERKPGPQRELWSPHLENAMEGLRLPTARRDELRAVIGMGH